MSYTFDENIVSDLLKDAFGSRRAEGFYRNWDIADDEGKQIIWDNLLIVLENSVNEEKTQTEKAVEAFEKRVSETIELGAGNRETAIRWIVDSLDLSEVDKMYGGEHVCFVMGLPYNMEAVFNEALAL